MITERLVWMLPALAFASVAFAAPIGTLRVEGTVSSVDPTLDFQFDVGDSARYSFLIDLSASDTNPAAARGEYFGGAFEATIGSYALQAGGTTILVLNDDPSGDLLGLSNTALAGAPVAPPQQQVRPVFGQLTLTAPPEVFASDALPATLDLAAFDGQRVRLAFALPGSAEFRDVDVTMAAFSVTTLPSGESVYRFEGAVTNVDPSLAGSFEIGEHASFSFVAGAMLTDTDTAPGRGEYAIGAFDIVIGDYTAEAPGTRVLVVNDDPNGGGDLIAFSTSPLTGNLFGDPVPIDSGLPTLRPAYSVLSLGSGFDAFESDAIPMTLSLSAFDIARGEFGFFEPISSTFAKLGIDLTSLIFEVPPTGPVAVPAPSPIWLFGIGALALAWFQRFARHHRAGAIRPLFIGCAQA
jgi:hypothetical protein